MSRNPEEEKSSSLECNQVSRRQFLKWAGVTGVAVGVGGALAGCGGDDETTTTTAAGSSTSETTATTAGGEPGREIKIGYVSPQTGPLAGFGEADAFILGGVNTALAGGLTIGDKTHPVTVIVKDTTSDPDRAAEVAQELILNDEVDLIVVSSTPETVNPVSDQCEANGVPCISTVAPWQAWYLDATGNPRMEFAWTYHFFWGLEDIIAVFQDMWGAVTNNKVVGGLWPADGDGEAWSGPKGFPPALEAAGYTVVDPGRYPNGTTDFSAQISAFKDAGADIVTGVPIPPDWTTFWTQAAQQGYQPPIASVGKALLFPSSVEALGDLGDGMSTEVWWTPMHPFSSSLTGASSADVAAAYTQETSKQWTQPIGFVHALFELAADALKRTADVDDKAAIVEAIKTTKLDTIVGPIDWSTGPVPNVSKTPLVGGQWVKGTDFPYEMVIVSNSLASDIPTTATLKPIPYS